MNEKASQTDTRREIINLIGFIVSSGSIFVGFLYYIGRLYTEAYYGALGIPARMLSFDSADYLYLGIRSWIFVLAGILTYLALRLWRSYKEYCESPKVGTPSVHKGFRKKLKAIFYAVALLDETKPQLIPVGYLFYLCVVIIVVFAGIMPTLERNLPGESLTQICLSILIIGSAFFVIKHRPTTEFIRKRRRLYWSFVSAVLLAIIASTQILPMGWGTFRGIYDGSLHRALQVFPMVQITVSERVGPDDLCWEMTTNGSYVAKEGLLLLHTTEDAMFLRQINGDTFAVTTQNILGFEIQVPGKTSSR